MNREVIPMEDLNIVFDDSSAEEFAKKVLNGNSIVIKKLLNL